MARSDFEKMALTETHRAVTKTLMKGQTVAAAEKTCSVRSMKVLMNVAEIRHIFLTS